MGCHTYHISPFVHGSGRVNTDVLMTLLPGCLLLLGAFQLPLAHYYHKITANEIAVLVAYITGKAMILIAGRMYIQIYMQIYGRMFLCSIICRRFLVFKLLILDVYPFSYWKKKLFKRSFWSHQRQRCCPYWKVNKRLNFTCILLCMFFTKM